MNEIIKPIIIVFLGSYLFDVCSSFWKFWVEGSAKVLFFLQSVYVDYILKMSWKMQSIVYFVETIANFRINYF